MSWAGHRGKGPFSVTFFVIQMSSGACSVPAPEQSNVGNGDEQVQSLSLGTLSIDRTGSFFVHHIGGSWKLSEQGCQVPLRRCWLLGP